MNRLQIKFVGFLMLAAAVASCDRPGTRQKLEQLTAVSAEKDSLLVLVSENTRLMSEISSTLAKVRERRRPVSAVAAAESPLAASVGFRDSIKAKISDVVERMNQAETRLAASATRLRNMGAMSDSMKAQIAMMEQSVNEFRTTIEGQRATIDQLTQETDALKTQNAELTERTVALTDTVSKLDTEKNTVYYVVGTKNELKERGVLVEEGSKFLIFGAKTVAPARNLSPEKFTAVDMRQTANIPLPNPERSYKIVSRQNLQALGTEVKDGKVEGGNLKINEPTTFWAPSKFLIIIEG